MQYKRTLDSLKKTNNKKEMVSRFHVERTSYQGIHDPFSKHYLNFESHKKEFGKLRIDLKHQREESNQKEKSDLQLKEQMLEQYQVEYGLRIPHKQKEKMKN